MLLDCVDELASLSRLASEWRQLTLHGAALSQHSS